MFLKKGWEHQVNSKSDLLGKYGSQISEGLNNSKIWELGNISTSDVQAVVPIQIRHHAHMTESA
jgi:hypothetical protein